MNNDTKFVQLIAVNPGYYLLEPFFDFAPTPMELKGFTPLPIIAFGLDTEGDVSPITPSKRFFEEEEGLGHAILEASTGKVYTFNTIFASAEALA